MQEFRDEMQYVRSRVDGIADTLAHNTAILEKNTESLKEHMRRTEILETQMETALIPIKSVKILAYIFGLITAIGSGIMAVMQFFK